MSITRINEFQAREGQADALRERIGAFVPRIASSEGCRSCMLLQGLDDPNRIVVIEVWDSVEAHRAVLQNVPPEAFAETMALLAGAPQGAYYLD